MSNKPLYCERVLANLQKTPEGLAILDKLHRMLESHCERCEWLMKPNRYFNGHISPAEAVIQNRLKEVLGALDALETGSYL